LISAILYLLSSISFFGISFIFYKSHNGLLRKIFISITAVVGWGTFIRFLSYLFPGFISEEIVVLFITIPFVVTGLPSFIFLYLKYYKKQQL